MLLLSNTYQHYNWYHCCNIFRDALSRCGHGAIMHLFVATAHAHTRIASEVSAACQQDQPRTGTWHCLVVFSYIELCVIGIYWWLLIIQMHPLSKVPDQSIYLFVCDRSKSVINSVLDSNGIFITNWHFPVGSYRNTFCPFKLTVLTTYALSKKRKYIYIPEILTL